MTEKQTAVLACGATHPGITSGVYHLPYLESVTGYRHAFARRPGGAIEYSRVGGHPADPRCPECADRPKPLPEDPR